MKKYLILFVVLALVACNNNNDIPALKGISLNKTKVSLEEGDTYRLKVIYEPEEAEEFAPEVEWTSSSTKVAKVDDNGKVTAKAIGVATITATCGKFEAECEITVEKGEPDNKLRLNEHEWEITMSDTEEDYVLLVSFEPAEAEVDASLLVWSTSDETVCDVKDGVLKIMNTGEAYIKVSYEDYAPDSCLVRIYPPVVLFEGFRVSETKSVAFSEGNLQYQPSTNTWRFALKQFIAYGPKNLNASETYEGWLDLYAWGTGDRPTVMDGNPDNYPDFVDWGINKIWNGGDLAWKTLTREEWEYLVENRPNAEARRGYARITYIDDESNEKMETGLVLLPDAVSVSSSVFKTGDTSLNKFTSEEAWNSFVYQTGAVFLPTTGCRTYYSATGEWFMTDTGSGEYWASNGDWSTASFLQFTDGKAPDMYISGKHAGRAVRLVVAK